MFLQKIIDKIYRLPKSRCANLNRFGGYFSYRKMMGNSVLMQKKSLQLPPVTSYPDGLEVHFLTGKKYLYQTLFCIQSLARFSKARLKFILVDDGTFDEEIIKQINRQLPGAAIVLQSQISENLAKTLPISYYPTLHHKRKVYPHIKKLTDIHTIPGNEWKLVLDADMLFWAEPTDLVNWLKKPSQPIYMLDSTQSYGYSTSLMAQLSNNLIPELLNVGVIGLNNTSIKWKEIEEWIKKLEEKEGTSYYLEQALTAMLVGNTSSTILNRADYIVNPTDDAIGNQTGILHHYVDLSKKGYFNIAWKKLI